MPAPRGNFIWYDLMTTDVDAAQKFYGDVVGWGGRAPWAAPGALTASRWLAVSTTSMSTMSRTSSRLGVAISPP